MTIYWPERRQHDWDNNKGFFDALNGIVWEDDGQIKGGRVAVENDKANPRPDLVAETLRVPNPLQDGFDFE